MCDTDMDPCDVWNETTQKARKSHRCDECGLPVTPGRLYVRVGSLYDGRWDTYRAHNECRALVRFVEKEVCGDHGSIPIGGLDEEISNMDAYDGDRRDDELDDLRAMGFGSYLEDESEWELYPDAKDVVTWLWDCIKAEYESEARPAWAKNSQQ